VVSTRTQGEWERNRTAYGTDYNANHGETRGGESKKELSWEGQHISLGRSE